MNQKFRLRQLHPPDSPALAKLITEFDDDLTTRFQVDPYETISFGTEFRTVGVVVECEGTDGFVGMGTVRFGKVQFNGEVLPFAFLDGLKVRREFRGQGLGYQIARWRIQQARESYRDQCVIATGMLRTNHASHAVAAKWCREFTEAALSIVIMPCRTEPPRPLTGISVRELEAVEYEEFAFKQNAFYENHNLYAPSDVNSIAHALSVSVENKKPYRFFAALDQHENLVAGAQTWARGVLKFDTINNPPTPLRLMNKMLHLLPSDFIIRDIAVNGLWYGSDQLGAAKHLWESIRWQCRDQGNTVTAGFDPRDPARNAVELKPWHQPRPQITLAIHGPSPIEQDRTIFSLGRV